MTHHHHDADTTPRPARIAFLEGRTLPVHTWAGMDVVLFSDLHVALGRSHQFARDLIREAGVSELCDMLTGGDLAAFYAENPAALADESDTRARTATKRKIVHIDAVRAMADARELNYGEPCAAPRPPVVPLTPRHVPVPVVVEEALIEALRKDGVVHLDGFARAGGYAPVVVSQAAKRLVDLRKAKRKGRSRIKAIGAIADAVNKPKPAEPPATTTPEERAEIEELTALRSRCQGLEVAVQDLKRKREQDEQIRRSLERQIQHLRESDNTTGDEITDARIAHLESENARLTKLAEATRLLRRSRDEAVSDLVQVRNNLAVAVRERSEAVQAMEHANGEAARLRKALKAAKAQVCEEVSTLRSELDTLTDGLSAAQEHASAVAVTVEATEKAHRERIIGLIRDLTLAEEQIDQLKAGTPIDHASRATAALEAIKGLSALSTPEERAMWRAWCREELGVNLPEAG